MLLPISLSFKDFSSAYFVDSKPNIISADEIISEPNKTIAIPAKQPALTQESPTKKPRFQTKYKIPVVPTIIIFDEGEEVKRFQADLSFKMVATKREVQDYIDELIISKF